MTNENLQACNDAVNVMIATSTANKNATNYNDIIDNEWGAAHDVWENKKKANEDAQTNWDNRKKEIFISKGNDRQNTRNTSIISYAYWCTDDYGSGWTDAGNQPSSTLGQNFRSCKKTDILRWSEAEAQVISEKGARPGDFNDPEPKKNEGEYVHQNNDQPLGTITCCANISNIIGSTLNDTQLKQLNNCKTEQSNINQSNPESTSIPKVDQSNLESTVPTSTEAPKSTNNILIVTIIFILLCISISSISGIISLVAIK